MRTLLGRQSKPWPPSSSTIGEVRPALVAGGERRAPPARGAHPLHGIDLFDGELGMAGERAFEAGERRLEHRRGDVFDVGVGRVEVEGDQPARRHPPRQRLEQGVEAQVVAVCGRRPAGLEVDDELGADAARRACR